MKTKNMLRLAFFVLAIVSLSFTGCKKEKNENPSNESASLQQLSLDEESVESGMDESMNDVNMLLSAGGLKSTDSLPCHATLDSTTVYNDTLTIYLTYDGLNCNQTRIRTGKVIIKKQIGTHWIDAGTTVIVRHIDFTITIVSNQKSFTVNSLKTHKNVSGGIIAQLGNETTTIVHRTWGHVNVAFEDGTAKVWNVARQKTFTGTYPNTLIMTTDGFGTSGEFNNLVVWGINRNGENFYTQIIQPVVHRQVCDWKPCSGIKKHSIPGDSKSATLTFGYDINNQPVTGEECPVKYKVDWQKNNHSGTVFLML